VDLAPGATDLLRSSFRMCRHFALRALVPSAAHDALVAETNALRLQSRKHEDGWGIAWYARGKPLVRKGLAAAHADPKFATAAGIARSTTVLAHVRDASCGLVTRENTHPFVRGPWVFCHNGTVARFERIRRRLEEEIDPALRRLIAGETDTERCFFLFLTRLAVQARRKASPTVEETATAMAHTVAVIQRIADAGVKKPSSLNFVVTDGRILFATRLGRSLVETSHELQPGARGRARRFLLVASERIGMGRPWREVPEGGYVASDPELGISRGALGRYLRRARRAA
jgi:glutamine amidotransferase